jgi:peroxiredoxin
MRRTSIFTLLIVNAIAAASMGATIGQKKDDIKPAPDFALKDLSGKTAQVADYRGKVLLINFWATWCPPCRAEMPDLVEWQKQHEARGLQIIGVTYPPHKINTVRRVAERLNINYPILLGSLRVAADYGVEEVLPVTVIVDREGNIRDRILGIMDDEEFEQKVMPLLR